MIVHVRLLYEFRDEMVPVSNVEEIRSLLSSIQEVPSFNFIVYKVGLKPVYQSLILGYSSNRYSLHFDDYTNPQFDGIENSSVEDFYFHLHSLLDQEESECCRDFFEKLTLRNKEKEKERLVEWKKNYRKTQLQEKKHQIKKGVFVAVVLVLMAIVGLWKTGYFKFLLEETVVVKAVVSDVDLIYNTSYMGTTQKLNFTYRVNEKYFANSVVMDRSAGRCFEGDTLVVKVLREDPSTFEILRHIEGTE